MRRLRRTTPTRSGPPIRFSIRSQSSLGSGVVNAHAEQLGRTVRVVDESPCRSSCKDPGRSTRGASRRSNFQRRDRLHRLRRPRRGRSISRHADADSRPRLFAQSQNSTRIERRDDRAVDEGARPSNARPPTSTTAVRYGRGQLDRVYRTTRTAQLSGSPPPGRDPGSGVQDWAHAPVSTVLDEGPRQRADRWITAP